MLKIAEPGVDVGNISEKPVHDVNEVGELGKQRTPVQFPESLPIALSVISVIPVPEAMDVHHVDFAEDSPPDHIMDPLAGRTVPVLHYTEYLPVHVERRVNNALTIRPVQGHWLLDHQVPGCCQDLEGVLCVQSVGGTHAYDITFRALLEHIPDGVKEGHIIGDPALLPGPHIAHGDQLGPRMAHDHFRMAFADVSGTNYRKSDGTHSPD